MTLKPAVRKGTKALVGFYGKSGSGKTMSALLFARGLVGEKGRISVIDTENGRASIFADLIPGGYQVLDLDAPFSPERYEQAMAVTEEQSDCVVIDSMSHEWGGEGGVLDMREEELEKFGGGDNNKMRSWIKPKMAHKQMVGRILRAKCHLICCLRGEEKTHVDEVGGRSKVVTDDFCSPIGDPRFIFEMLLNFETVARDGVGGFVVPRKITHPALRELLPGADEQIGIEHGRRMAQWCAYASGTPTPSTTKPKSVKLQIWELTKSKHGGNKDTLQQWLWDENIMDPEESLEIATPETLAAVLEKLKTKLS